MTFQPGQSGNPAGKKPGTLSVVSALKKKLAETDKKDGEKRTYLKQLIEKILEKGIKDGDVQMLKDIVNRVDGLPIAKIQHSGDEDNPVITKEVGIMSKEEIDEYLKNYANRST